MQGAQEVEERHGQQTGRTDFITKLIMVVNKAYCLYCYKKAKMYAVTIGFLLNEYARRRGLGGGCHQFGDL